MIFSKINWTKDYVLMISINRPHALKVEMKWRSPLVAVKTNSGRLICHWQLILIKTDVNKMTFAAKIYHSLKSEVRAYFNIKVSNNQRILITRLVQTEADFLKLKTRCENVVFENFMDYPTFSESYGDDPYAAIIECDVVFSINYIDKPNFLLPGKLAPWIQNKQHSDMEFEVEGQVLRGHKIILIAQSEVFNAMFQNEMIEQQSGVVKVEDISLDTFQELLRYIYTEQIPKLDELAGELLAAAEKYQLDDLKERCELQLASVTTVDNVVNMFFLADLYNADVLMQETLSFIKDKEILKEIFKQKKFWSLNAKLLKRIMIMVAEDLL